jgi:glycerate 2-kinase
VTEHGDESLCILGRGEIPVEVKADGKGGRNQHFALLVGCQLNHLSNWAFASLASDGCDYLKGIAGGYVTGQVLAEATALGGSVEQCIADTDSYAFHRRHQTHLYCDEGTGMNVSDIYVFVKMAGSTG